MSFLQQVQKVSAAHYVLPMIGDMRTEVHAYLSDTLFAQTDEALWRQAAQAAAYPGMIGLYLMPDTHLGYGIPVGGVAVTEDVIIQAGSGYDISCGVVYLKVPDLTAADIGDWDKRRRWIDDAELRIATGLGSQRPKHMPRLADAKIEEIFRYGAQAIGVRAARRARRSVQSARSSPDWIADQCVGRSAIDSRTQSGRISLSRSSARNLPVLTSAAAVPAASAPPTSPRISSPIISVRSGVVSSAASAAAKKGRAGLPSTRGSTPLACDNAVTNGAVSSRRPSAASQ